jgi:hypothetical protein
MGGKVQDLAKAITKLEVAYSTFQDIRDVP